MWRLKRAWPKLGQKVFEGVMLEVACKETWAELEAGLPKAAGLGREVALAMQRAGLEQEWVQQCVLLSRDMYIHHRSK